MSPWDAIISQVENANVLWVCRDAAAVKKKAAETEAVLREKTIAEWNRSRPAGLVLFHYQDMVREVDLAIACPKSLQAWVVGMSLALVVIEADVEMTEAMHQMVHLHRAMGAKIVNWE